MWPSLSRSGDDEGGETGTQVEFISGAQTGLQPGEGGRVLTEVGQVAGLEDVEDRVDLDPPVVTLPVQRDQVGRQEVGEVYEVSVSLSVFVVGLELLCGAALPGNSKTCRDMLHTCCLSSAPA